ncbi:trem-like transcript 4 protein isoform X2 [Mustela lutreola]|uniref:trem-like transcript 4 protein isoform X2 n=1 Tax=Mustela lutreola TaxID=9666 RepID=UPI002797A208|nr:trem-like transcript 4 protein isoform X2 [Mustela lutreola]
MAWEATCLLPPVLLVLLASGSWGQKPEMLHLLEGDSFSVKCLYPPQKGSEAVKFWCKWDLSRTCTLLATSPQLWGKPQNSIEDKVGRGYFIVTMTKLRVEDSGSYSCGIYKSSRKFFHRNIHLVVSRGAPVGPQPGLLPPALSLTGEDKSHHIYNNIAVQKEPGTEHRKDLSPRQRRSQLSWGSDQQKGSDEDTGAICYASLIHLNQFGPEDSIYVNTQPKLKPMPDPLLTVEYACIPGTRPQPTKSTAPDRELKS